MNHAIEFNWPSFIGQVRIPNPLVDFMLFMPWGVIAGFIKICVQFAIIQAGFNATFSVILCWSPMAFITETLIARVAFILKCVGG